MDGSGDEKRHKVRHWPGVLALVVLASAIFAGVVLERDGLVLSEPNSDLLIQGAHWREFGFGELRKGNLPLWNPHVFSGMPFFGSFESAMLYPPNLIYLVLPLTRAINVSAALHVFLAGLFMYLWASRRRLHPTACVVSASLLIFSGPVFMHVYAGHLSVVSSAAWIPLILLCADGLVEKPSMQWFLLGTFAVAMQVLAGHPQTVYYTAMAVFIYSALSAIPPTLALPLQGGGNVDSPSLRGRGQGGGGKAAGRHRGTATTLAAVLGIYAAAGSLTAVQLLTGIQAAGESVRGGGLPYDYASTFALPPENLITLLVPAFFGNIRAFPYWGRCYLWEMSLFMTVTGFFLMAYGAVKGERSSRRLCLAMAVILIILALGAHTAVYRLLYSVLPGFDSFRGSSKFILQASVFLALLAGVGLDRLLKERRVPRAFPGAILGTAILLGLAAMAIRYSAFDPSGFWHSMILRIGETGEGVIPADVYSDPYFVLKAGVFAASWLLWSAVICVILALLLLKPMKATAYVICGMAILEGFLFARSYKVVADVKSAGSPLVDQIVADNPGDYRVLRLQGLNIAMSSHRQDMWGYDPLVSRRYAEFMAFTQGIDPDEAGTEIAVEQYHPLYALLRCRYVFRSESEAVNVMQAGHAMPRVSLVEGWVHKTGRDEIFAAMSDPSFDAAGTAILESTPKPGPVASKKQGKVRLASSSTDEMVIEADLPKPAILLITDPYSAGWRAQPLPESTQKRYDLMPADYTLKAIPLSAGFHRIRVEYMPTGFVVGRWISIVSVAAWLCASGVLLWRKRSSRITNHASDVHEEP